MGSIVLNDKDKNYDCYTCTNGSKFKREGRDKKYVRERTKALMINKGCTSDAKKPVIRLNNGEKIYRCPKSICDDNDSLSYYSDYSCIRDGIFSYKPTEVTWKWSKALQTVRAELASNERERVNNLKRKSKPPVRRR